MRTEHDMLGEMPIDDGPTLIWMKWCGASNALNVSLRGTRY
ncbi:hypothetical protein Psfp_00306 [Pelotomaculum sp. FP]|nr:hypothetical protein Psfp_00306 [Pelotomaculum sp. FP]